MSKYNERNTDESLGKSRQSPGFNIRETHQQPSGDWKESGDNVYDRSRDQTGWTGVKKIGDAPTWKTPE